VRRGQAALQAKALAQRFVLTSEVPCRGSDLQARCQLLGDAHEAHALIPSAHAALQRLADERTTVQREAHRVRACAEAQVAAERDVAAAERRLERARRRLVRYAQLAARAQEVGAARRRLFEIEGELTGLKVLPDSTPSSVGHVEREECDAVAAALRSIAGERTRQAEQLRLTLARLDAVLSAMPPAFDARTLSDAEAARERAVATHAEAERAHVEALRQAQTLAAMNAELASLAERRALAARRIERIESAVGDWTLLARGMSNDGLVALAIDDAGPALSALANDLLLACYGPRFTVSILTQTETAKGERREDFDIVVHDAEVDESKSVKMMSGGERVWINECLVRAVALYLAQTSDRRHETLCSDEADGALDPARKRMFGAMKREVLRLGGYRREFFISQTPELAGMADAVIDLDRYALPQIGLEQAADATA
jgi:exonuclease SbcC